jgi:hypothetical protein
MVVTQPEESAGTVEGDAAGSGAVRPAPTPPTVGPFDPVALVCLQIVVPVTEADQVGQSCRPTPAEWVDVIDLQRLTDVAPRDGAHLVPLDEGPSE